MGEAHDFDEEFNNLISGLEPTDESTVEAEGDKNANDAETDLDTPVDESLHLDEGSLSVALVLSPISSPEALHALLALGGQRCDVVRLKPWSAVWMQLHSAPTEEEQMEILLSGKSHIPEPVDDCARRISQLSKYGAVAIISWLVESEDTPEGVSGQITAKRYVHGEPEDEIPAGVLLGAMPPEAEDLLLGRTQPSDYPGSLGPDDAPKAPRFPFGRFRKPRGLN